MATPAWRTFVVGTLLLAVAVIALARRSARLLDRQELQAVPKPALYGTLALNQGVVLVAVAALLVWCAVPLTTLGTGEIPDLRAVVALSVALVLLNEAASYLTREASAANPLRALLAPRRPLDWVVLAVVLLPTIAVTEELLFRGLLIGGLGAGTELPAGLLVVASGIGFGLAHTAQGRQGVVVALGLGLVLGAAYHLSGSLWLVVAAHYLVDLVEFLVHAAPQNQSARPRRQG